MYLSDFSRHANHAARERRRIAMRGVVPNGASVWSEAEDATCRRLHPDYATLVKALPSRTRRAIQMRCGILGLCAGSTPWTGKERTQFRKMYASTPREQLLQAFPNRTQRSLERQAARMGLLRAKPGYKPTGNELLDQLREQCFRQKITMVDLDTFANTKRYFTGKCWRGNRGTYNYRAILQCIKALGGRLTIEWIDL
ncbi:hypothetical protein [Mesorhizobium qingshengii]|uniref:Uncharacterized protein n=1 Tax=Mesorhizobium qingshengii TaxID=1165689 RepID=A0A1G5V5Z4_9HYPH|nr:hypothetical protein [Mesorhizobium qingshengii]SDA40415.1 hypothetical protein SAMN02927914_00236 [Mesorhizobium qingshengii]